LTDMQVISVFY